MFLRKCWIWHVVTIMFIHFHVYLEPIFLFHPSLHEKNLIFRKTSRFSLKTLKIAVFIGFLVIIVKSQKTRNFIIQSPKSQVFKNIFFQN